MPGGSLTPLQHETHFGEELLGNILGRGFGVVKGLSEELLNAVGKPFCH